MNVFIDFTAKQLHTDITRFEHRRSFALAAGPLPLLCLFTILCCAPSGCVVFERPLDPNAALYAPPPLPASLTAPFATDDNATSPPTLTWHEQRHTDAFVLRTAKLAHVRSATRNPIEVTLEWYAPQDASAETPAPLVLVMPILGGSYPVARYLGRFFPEIGWHAAFLHRLHPGEAILGNEEPRTLDLDARDTIRLYRRALDRLSTRPEVAPSQIGLVGISLGAIAGSVLLAVEPRIKAGVLIMGGGDLGGIISRSQEGPVRQLRAHLMHKYGLTEPRALAAKLRRELRFDPLVYAPYVGPERVLQMVSTHDDRIHAPFQWRLWEALGRPAVRAMPIGHYSAVIYLGYAKRELVAFLEQRFHPPSVHPTRRRRSERQRIVALRVFRPRQNPPPPRIPWRH